MCKLILKYGNILDYLDSVNAIVSSTNKYMISGSGVCVAIFKKANKEKLEKYCKENYSTEMKTNEIRITPGFELGIDIIHIYVPKYYESKNPIDDLLKSYENIFIIAKEKGYKNIISVSLGTGIHGYKHNEIGGVVINEITQLIVKFDITIILVLKDKMLLNFYKLF